jgi:hypothetical protein
MCVWCGVSLTACVQDLVDAVRVCADSWVGWLVGFVGAGAGSFLVAVEGAEPDAMSMKLGDFDEDRDAMPALTRLTRSRWRATTATPASRTWARWDARSLDAGTLRRTWTAPTGPWARGSTDT